MALLKGFEVPTEEDLRRLWNEGIFVLDASVLLSLHRYRDRAREDILSALDKVRDRLWIPFHVALEYERNRLKVISKQRANIQKAREKVQAIPETIRATLQDTEVFRRHAFINVEDLLKGLTDLSERFCGEIDAVRNSVPEVHNGDDVRARLEDVLKGRIGAPPQTQDEITNWNDFGAKRYARGQPPGYLDRSKETGKEGSTFMYGGLVYDLQYGDLYIWEQIKAQAKVLEGKPICFVTDDRKEDWWWLVDSEGPKRLGPRPELKEEIERECGVDLFHMYGPDAFLESMNRFRGAGIDPASVSEAREVSLERVRRTTKKEANNASTCVANWLHEKHHGDGSIFARSIFPDLLRLTSDQTVVAGYEVVTLHSLGMGSIEPRLHQAADAITGFLDKFPQAELRFMFVFYRKTAAETAFERVKSMDLSWLSERVAICTGHVDREDGSYRHTGCLLRASVSDELIVH